MKRRLLYYNQSIIEHLLKYDKFELLRLMEDWIQYNNPNLEAGIDLILEHSDDLTNEFFDRFLEILDRYNKTELALICVRHWIERKKKEKFEL